MNISTDIAYLLATEDVGTVLEGYQVMSNEQIGTRRWMSSHELVLKELSTGRFYSDYYELGLTESQESNIWEYEEPDFKEVFPKTITTVIYVKNK